MDKPKKTKLLEWSLDPSAPKPRANFSKSLPFWQFCSIFQTICGNQPLSKPLEILLPTCLVHIRTMRISMNYIIRIICYNISIRISTSQNLRVFGHSKKTSPFAKFQNKNKPIWKTKNIRHFSREFSMSSSRTLLGEFHSFYESAQLVELWELWIKWITSKQLPVN